MDINLKIQDIASENFSRFGKAIIPGTPDFSNDDFDWHECLAVLGFGMTEAGLVRVRNRGDYHQKTLERHLKTKEVIIPVSNDIILVLALNDAENENDYAAFLVPCGSAAAIHEGVWHQAPMCLPENTESAAFILYTEGTGKKDKEMFTLCQRNLHVTVDFI